MTFSFHWSAPEGSRVSSNVLILLEGQPVKFMLGDRVLEGRLVEYNVDEDGTGVDFTVEVEKGIAETLGLRWTPWPDKPGRKPGTAGTHPGNTTPNEEGSPPPVV